MSTPCLIPPDCSSFCFKFLLAGLGLGLSIAPFAYWFLRRCCILRRRRTMDQTSDNNTATTASTTNSKDKESPAAAPETSQCSVTMEVDPSSSSNFEDTINDKDNDNNPSELIGSVANIGVEPAEAPGGGSSRVDIDVKDQEQASSSSSNDDNNNAATASSGREINLLLLGETGTGKSTTGDALNAYLRWPKFRDILTELKDPVSEASRMTTMMGLNNNNNQQQQLGQATGESCTQFAGSYRFEYGASTGRQIEVIDSPGIGDTRGPEMDRENFDRTVQFIRQFKHLNGICILILSTQTRVTSAFRYCMEQLFDQLHPSALGNVFFCFTYARSSDFGPGDGFASLKKLLASDLKGINFQLKPDENCFFVDNEGFCNLISGFPSGQDEDEMERNEESWDLSAVSVKLMIEQVITRQPHDVRLTNQLHLTRQVNAIVAEPLAKMMYIRQEIADQIEEIKTKTANGKKRVKIQYFNSELVCEKLPSARMVCTEQQCAVRYESCHDPCEETASEGTFGSSQLQHCDKMAKEGLMIGMCQECGCHWSKHRRLTYQWKILYTGPKLLPRSNKPCASSSMEIKEFLRVESQRNKELNMFAAIAAKLEAVLRHNSNPTTNGSGHQLERYLNVEIEKAREMCQLLSGDNDNNQTALATLDRWLNIKAQHVEEVSDVLTFPETKQLSAHLWSRLVGVKPFSEVLKNIGNCDDF